MSRDITVAVFRGDYFVRWAKNRPLRAHPAGHIGVVFGGQVMPVYEHRSDSLSIDLSDEGHPPEDCPFWPDRKEQVFADQSLVLASSTELEWYMESNSFGHYVVLDGSKQLLNKVLNGLEQVGLGVIRVGASTRKADNGHHYDWFIRLDFNGSREEALSLARDGIALSNLSFDPQKVTDPDHSIVLKDLVSDLIAAKLEDAGLTSSEPSVIIRWLSQLNHEILEDAEEEISNLQEELENSLRNEEIAQRALLRGNVL